MIDGTDQKTEKQIPEELKRIVIARLNLIPDNVEISVGTEGEFTREELIRRVEMGDRVGNQIAKSQLEFLQALSEGRLLDDLIGNSS